MNKKELGIIILFSIGLFFARFVSIDNLLLKGIILFGLGLYFEVVLANLWTYCPELSNSRLCVKGADINFLFPFGWIGLALTASSLVKVVLSNFSVNTYIVYVLCFMLIGTTVEATYLNLNYWKYNYNEKVIGLYKPFMLGIRIFKVPVEIVLAYGFIWGTVIYLTDTYLINYIIN